MTGRTRTMTDTPAEDIPTEDVEPEEGGADHDPYEGDFDGKQDPEASVH